MLASCGELPKDVGAFVVCKTKFHTKFKGPTHLTQEINKALLSC